MLDYSAANITYDEKGLVEFDLIKNRKAVDHIQLSVTGDHNVSNALASIATAELLQIPMETIKKGILSFSGTDRRFEYKGTFNGVTVVDDYAHHPTEIAATLKAAQHYPHNQVWCETGPPWVDGNKAFQQAVMNNPELRQNGLVPVFCIVQHSLNRVEIITAYNGVMVGRVARLWFLTAIF